MSDMCVKPEIGMGATKFLYTDRHAYTIIAISPSGKTLTLQRDKAERTDKNGMSEAQVYKYEADPRGEIVKVRLNKAGQWKYKGQGFGIGFRSEYYDYSF